jgi:hypothetical protein
MTLRLSKTLSANGLAKSYLVLGQECRAAPFKQDLSSDELQGYTFVSKVSDE